MNFWKVILATIVIYGAGVMTGGLLVNQVDRPHPRNRTHPETPVASGNSNSLTNVQGLAASRTARLPEMLSRQFLQQLDEELRLSPDERVAIAKIITDSQNLMRKTMTDARLEIREQLTPAQQKQFDELVKRSPPRRPPGATNAPPASPPAKAPATNAPGV